MSAEALAALRELVALKDLKDREARLRQRRLVSIKRDPLAVAQVDQIRDDYNRRKPLAWHAARVALAKLKKDNGMSVKESTACRWSQDDEDSDTWATTCGHYFTIIADTPSENDMRFCCYCGKPLVELRFEDGQT